MTLFALAVFVLPPLLPPRFLWNVLRFMFFPLLIDWVDLDAEEDHALLVTDRPDPPPLQRDEELPCRRRPRLPGPHLMPAQNTNPPRLRPTKKMISMLEPDSVVDSRGWANSPLTAPRTWPTTTV